MGINKDGTVIILYRKAMDNNMANLRESVGIYSHLNWGGVTVDGEIKAGPKINGNMIRHYIFEKFVDFAEKHAKTQDGVHYLGLTSTALIKEGYRYPKITPKIEYRNGWVFKKVTSNNQVEIHGVGEVEVQNGKIVKANDVFATNDKELVEYFADADIFGYLLPSESSRRTSILHVSDAVAAVTKIVFQTVHTRMKVSDEFERFIEAGTKTQQRMVREVASGVYVGEIAIDYTRLGQTDVVEDGEYKRTRVIDDEEYKRRKRLLNLAVAEVLLNPFGANRARNQPLTHLVDALIVVVKDTPMRPALIPPQYPDYISKSIKNIKEFVDTAKTLGYNPTVEVYIYYNDELFLKDEKEEESKKKSEDKMNKDQDVPIKILTTPEELRKALIDI